MINRRDRRAPRCDGTRKAGKVRWERLFEDLEAQWDADAQASRAAEVADRTRRERATVTLVDRLAVHRGKLAILLAGGQRVEGEPQEIGADFVVLAEHGRRHLVPLAAVVQITGLGGRSAGARQAARIRRFGLGYALRALARDRVAVVLEDLSGRSLTGTVDVVGADHLDLSEHPLDLPRRGEYVQGRRCLPLYALVCVSLG
ncbi:hypothetical protein [Austwickia chelonae]|uniref:hypothetical protein n=1 Tax=Austwickia chelonae TaxID=100225 RepID=UPI001FE1D344|nr:hypothetical protein [Austwickia chelonae]